MQDSAGDLLDSLKLSLIIVRGSTTDWIIFLWLDTGFILQAMVS